MAGATDAIALEISLPFRTQIAVTICSTRPQKTVRQRMDFLLLDSRNAIARMRTNPIRAEKRSIATPFRYTIVNRRALVTERGSSVNEIVQHARAVECSDRE